jgi:hypothetical protein
MLPKHFATPANPKKPAWNSLSPQTRSTGFGAQQPKTNDECFAEFGEQKFAANALPRKNFRNQIVFFSDEGLSALKFSETVDPWVNRFHFLSLLNVDCWPARCGCWQTLNRQLSHDAVLDSQLTIYCHGIKHSPIVGDQQQRALIGRQCRFELFDGHEIQMVGWLVKH